MSKIKNNKDAVKFASLLKRAKLENNELQFGKFFLPIKKGIESNIQYNNEEWQLLNDSQEYTLSLLNNEVQISLQLYENVNHHYRLFCFTKCDGKTGMTFSLNLTTEKESSNTIFLTQKIKFSERYNGDSELAKAHRRQKQIVFADLLSRLGIEVTENFDVILGIFDPTKGELINTSSEKFLNDFMIISLFKGHFQGNKGFQLDVLPNYNQLDYIFNNDNKASKIPLKTIKNKTKRVIPLSLRYLILNRDGNKCVVCGRTAKDGIKLHIDHKKPFSLGGMTEKNNLQTLCNECNIGKSNKFIDI